MQRKLWYDKEAKVWEEALPIGNGRIGAMAFSGALSDRFQISEETLWSGYPNMMPEKHSMADIEEVRELIRQKKYKEATDKTSDILFGVTSQGYLSYGSLYIDFMGATSDVKEYKRELDLETGVLKSEYKIGDNLIEKESFISLVDDVLVIRVKSKEEMKYHIYQSVEPNHSVRCTEDTVIHNGKCPTDLNFDEQTLEYDDNKESIEFSSRLKVISNNHTFTSGTSIWVKNTNEIIVIFSLKTSFNGYEKMPVSEGKEYKEAALNTLNDALEFSFDELKNRHTNEYKKYFDRVSLTIDGEDLSYLPTDVRIKNIADGVVDNHLTAILFDYARYLTITSSLCGTQPTTLQGIWNYEMVAPWNCNYTMNINTQMNYWAVEAMNLGECHHSLFNMLEDLYKKGNVFGLRGWASWHNSDIWRFNYGATKGVRWGFWLMGGFWATRHIWEHYLHTRDIEFLKKYYPIMVGGAEFLEDWMCENEKGELVTSPSTSPENVFRYNNEICCVCEGSAMDMSIISDLYDKTIKAAEILGEDATHLREIRAKLSPVKIGEDGRILEWGTELEEVELGHRHISHLYGFYPADVLKYDEYSDAIRKTLKTRMENGGGHTGWSNAWIAAVYARLKDSEKLYFHIKNMFVKSMYPNMFDAHPPFQIDGNFGIAAAICEALMQSHTDKLELLPALPKEWKSGEVKGFISRTGDFVDFKWKDGEIVSQNIRKFNS